MRIRKRFPPSSLSSLPLSDPQLNRSPVVQHHLQGGTQAHPDGNLSLQEGMACPQPSDPPNQPPPTASDQHPTIGSGRARWVCSDSTKTQEVKQKELEGEEVKEERWEEEEKSNDTRKGRILGAEVGTGLQPPTGSSHEEVERWFEGDKIVPPKKRRGSFERIGDDKDAIMEKENKTKAKMKSKTNKKCVQPNGDEQGGRETKEGIDSAGLKKIKRGNVIMEGSRCSRVNGRGWRCCQQTLVGYSLCEHHLGKGRLRSMTSVRSRAMAKKDESGRLSSSLSLVQEKQVGQRLLDEDEDEDEDDDDDDEKKPLMMTKKKRMKLGRVKARSISSLLGQTNNAVVVADKNNKNSSV